MSEVTLEQIVRDSLIASGLYRGETYRKALLREPKTGITIIGFARDGVDLKNEKPIVYFTSTWEQLPDTVRQQTISNHGESAAIDFATFHIVAAPEWIEFLEDDEAVSHE